MCGRERKCVRDRDRKREHERESTRGTHRLARRVLGCSYSATAPASITSTRSESTTVDSLRDRASSGSAPRDSTLREDQIGIKCQVVESCKQVVG
jgi:hypothetical protein